MIFQKSGFTEMSYRFMRILIFFDLPTLTKKDRREYTKFRRSLLTNGFMMLQESVYCKLAVNMTVASAVMETIRKNKPPAGLVQMLCITEKQFAKMEIITGSFYSEIIDNEERLIIL